MGFNSAFKGLSYRCDDIPNAVTYSSLCHTLLLRYCTNTSTVLTVVMLRSGMW